MMKRIIIFTLLLFIAFILISCGSNDIDEINESEAVSDSLESSAQSQVASLITLGEAKAIALGDANLDEEDVVFVRAELFDGARKIYDIEFTADGKEWDYEINAKNGQIMGFDNKLDIE